MAASYRYRWWFRPPGERSAGKRSERLARRFLKSRGLKPVTANWAARSGEIDLVMLDAEVLVFVEVRMRSARAWTDGLASVDGGKQRRIARTARLYLASHPEHEHRATRFDVVALAHSHYRVTLEWTRNAFDDTTC